MKGVVIPTVVWLILAVVCIVVLVIFFSRLVPAVGQFVDAAISGMISKICDQVGVFSWFCHMFTGK